MKRRKNLYFTERIKKEDKTVSFIRHSPLESRYIRKFFVVYPNLRVGYPGNYAFIKRKKESKKSRDILKTIISGYLLVFMATYASFSRFLRRTYNKHRRKLFKSWLTIKDFYYFFDNHFEIFYNYNEHLRDLSNWYILEHTYKDFIIDLYNIKLFSKLKRFYVYFNIEDITYQHKKCLTKRKDWHKIPKMKLGLSNLDYEEHLNSFFDAFCVFELFIEYDNCFFNRFNEQFFDLYLIRNVNKYKLNSIINFNRFTVDIPSIFFMLRTYYALHWRWVLYNYYIKNNPILYEYPSIKDLFIRLNNPGGINRTKIPYWEFQWMITLRHFNCRMPATLINSWFNLYDVDFDYMTKIEEHNKDLDSIIFKSLINKPQLQYAIKIQNNAYFQLIYDYFNESLLPFMQQRSIIDGYQLLMQFKHTGKIRLVNSTYNDIEEFVWAVYSWPGAAFRLYLYLGCRELGALYKDIYEKQLKSSYFLRDLYNYNNISYLFYYLNITSFYQNLFFLVFYIFDPSFFYWYQMACFPKAKRYMKVLYYTALNMVMYELEEFDKLSHEFLENLNRINFYLQWRLNIINLNHYDSEEYIQANAMVDTINAERIRSVTMRGHFFLNSSNIDFLYDRYKYYLYIVDHYLQMLFENVELCLLFFFLNKRRFIRHKNSIIDKSLSSRLAANFTYRYYVVFLKLNFRHYDDWYTNTIKRDQWIFHWIYTNWKQYEGPYFYKNDVVYRDELDIYQIL